MEEAVAISVIMQVDDPQAFVSDPAVEQALVNGMSSIVGMPPSFISVSMAVTDPVRRRLGAGFKRNPALAALARRRLQGGSVQVDYVIIVPGTHSSVQDVVGTVEAMPATAIAAVIAAEISAHAGSGAYAVSVASVTAETLRRTPIVTEAPANAETLAAMTEVEDEPLLGGTELLVLALVLLGISAMLVVLAVRCRRGCFKGRGGVGQPQAGPPQAMPEELDIEMDCQCHAEAIVALDCSSEDMDGALPENAAEDQLVMEVDEAIDVDLELALPRTTCQGESESRPLVSICI
jgi:hypothetical protein